VVPSAAHSRADAVRVQREQGAHRAERIATDGGDVHRIHRRIDDMDRMILAEQVDEAAKIVDLCAHFWRTSQQRLWRGLLAVPTAMPLTCTFPP